MNHIESYAAKGKIYFPFAVVIQNYKAQTKNTETALLKIINISDRENIQIPLKSTEVKKNKSLIFKSEKVIALDPGEYRISGVFISSKNGERNHVEIPINFSVKDRKITPIKSVLIVFNDSSFENYSLNYVNKNSIDFAVLKKNIPNLKANDLISKDQNNLIVEESMPTQSSRSVLHGYKFSVPCDFRGYTKLNFVKNENPIAYYKIDEIKTSCPKLENMHRVAIKVRLTEGKWSTNYASIINNNSEKLKIFYMVNKFGLTSYFETNKTRFIKDNGFFRDFKKDISFDVDSNNSNYFHFIGTFEAVPYPSDLEQFKITFNRRYDMRNIRNSFNEKKILNPFSSLKMQKDKILGNIQITVKSIKFDDSSEDIIESLKKEIIAIFDTCIKIQDKSNPLLSINGKVLITNKNSKIDLTPDSFNIRESGSEIDEMRTCVQKALSKKEVDSDINKFLLEVSLHSL